MDAGGKNKDKVYAEYLVLHETNYFKIITISKGVLRPCLLSIFPTFV